MKVVEIERIRPHFETRQNLQDHQRDDSLPVRRTFIDGSSSKLRLDRLDIFPFGCGEVVQRMQPAQAVEISDHVLGDCAAIECVQPFAADRLQGFREFGLPLDRPYLRRPVPAQKGPPGGGIEFEEIALVGDVESDARGDCVTVARQIDGGRKERRQGKLAVICDQTRPGFDRAGDGHGVRRMTLDRLDAALSVPFGGRGRRRPSRAVVGDDVFRSAPAEQRETIPADSRRPRLDHALDGACGDGRVDGVSAAFQDLDGRQGRGAVGRGRHPILACGHRSAGKFKIAHGFHLALPDFIGGEAVSFLCDANGQ